MKLESLFELYTQEKPTLSPRTVGKYLAVIKLFIKDTGIDNIYMARDEYIQWRNNVLHRSSAGNFNNYHRHLKALLNFAVKIGKIEDSFLNSIKPFKTNKKKSKLIQDSTIKELNLLFENDPHYSKVGWFYVVIIDMLRYTGIRRRQLIGIKWKDVDICNAQLYLSAEFSKNGQENLIPLNQCLINHLKTLKNRPEVTRPNDQVFNLAKFAKNYSSNQSNETSAEQISGLFARLSKKIGRSVSPHQFRHRFATEIANNGGNIKTLSEFLSHSDVRTTMIYVQPDMDSKRNIQNIINTVI